MSLGLGANKASQSSSSQSESYGYNISDANSVSQSIQNAMSTGQSTSNQAVFGDNIFSSLYGNASNAAQGAVAQAPELTAAARQLFTGGTQFLDQLGDNAGTEYLTNRLGDDSVLNSQIDVLRDQSSKLFSEDLNPAITSRAVAGGVLGGGRQGVAQGQAIDAVMSQFNQGVVALQANNQAQKDAAATSVANNSVAAASTGLGALPGLLDVLSSGVNSELGIYKNLAGILGGPTTLTSSQSSNMSQSLAEALSQSQATSRSEQESSSSSRSKGKSWGFNVSGGLTS